MELSVENDIPDDGCLFCSLPYAILYAFDFGYFALCLGSSSLYFNIGLFFCEFIVIYTISRGVFMIRGFQFTDFRLYHFYVFSYIMYGAHKMTYFSTWFPSGSILFKSQMDGVRVVY